MHLFTKVVVGDVFRLRKINYLALPLFSNIYFFINMKKKKLASLWRDPNRHFHVWHKICIVIKTLTCIPQIISLLFSFFAMYSVCTHGLAHHVTPTLCLEASTNMYICECHLYWILFLCKLFCTIAHDKI